MSLGAQIIIALLVVLIALVVFIAVKVRGAFRNLTAERLRLYTAQMGNLNEMVHQLRTNARRGAPFPYPEPKLDGEVFLIGSVPVMQLNQDVWAACADLFEKTSSKAPEDEIAAAIAVAEKKLEELNLAMREDLALSAGDGRIPNADVFRRNRGQS